MSDGVIRRARDHYFVIDGRPSSDFGIICSKDNGFDAPARDVETISVQGRNGDLHVDKGRWTNASVTYTCTIERDFAEKFAEFRKFVSNLRGYQRLEDTFHPGEYRMALLNGGITADRLGTRYNSGKFDLTFNCKPQRFMKSGEEPIYMMPPIPVGATEVHSTVYTYPSDLPADYKTISITLETAQTGVSAKIRYFTDYDSDSTDYFDSAFENLSRGEQVDFNLGESGVKHWQIFITKSADDDLDEMIFRVQAPAVIGDEPVNMNARMARSVKITNPTGFRSKPLFRVYGSVFPLSDVITESETWNIVSDSYSDLSNDAYIDCENEYFYYVDSDNKKHNITGRLTIERYDADGNTLPVSFPELGEDETTLYISLPMVYKDSFVVMYPHWFTI